MCDIINIENIDDLKITKVKNWAIYFTYKSNYYILYGSDEMGEGSWQTLYERKFDELGKYSLNPIKTNNYAEEHVRYDYIKQQKGNTIVYSQIDKKYFAYKLAKRGFATGIYLNEINEKQNKIDILKSELKIYEEKCREINVKISKLI